MRSARGSLTAASSGESHVLSDKRVSVRRTRSSCCFEDSPPF